MATTLKSLIQFVNVPAGGSVTLPHNIKIPAGGQASGERAIRPDVAFVVGAADTDFTFANVGQDQIQATNNGSVAQGVTLLCEWWHSLERGFGAVATTELQSPTIFIYSARALSAGSSCGVSIDPGNNKAAEINAAIVALNALFLADGRKRTLQLLCGTYGLEAPIAQLSGVEIAGEGIGKTILRGDFAGAADDPLNALIRAVGTIDAVTLNSTLAAFINKGTPGPVNFTAVGTLVAGQYVLISGRNAVTDTLGDFPTGANVSFAEILPVAQIVGAAVTFSRMTWEYHSSGVQVRRVIPVTKVGLRNLTLQGGAGSAVGALYRSCIDVEVEHVAGLTLSRAIIDLDLGTTDYRVNDVRDEGACNTSVFLDSVFQGTVKRLVTNPEGARFNAAGVTGRGVLHARNRVTGLVVRDCVLVGRTVGMNLYGVRHALFSDLEIRDMDGAQADVRLTAAGEMQGHILGVGVSGNSSAVANFGEYNIDCHFENVEAHDLRPGNAAGGWHLLQDFKDSTFRGFGLYNDGISDGVVNINGILWVDTFSSVMIGVRFRGISNCFTFTNSGPVSCSIEDVYYEGNAGVAAANSVLLNFQHGTQTKAVFRRMQTVNASSIVTIVYAGAFADYSLRFYDYCFSNAERPFSYAMPALNSTGINPVACDLLAMDAASPAGTLRAVRTGGAANQKGIIACEFPTGGFLTVAPVPQLQAFVNCDNAIVNVGDELVASATQEQATPAALPVAFTTIGRAVRSKAAGAPGIVEITT